MSMIVSENEKVELLEEGVYKAICHAVIDIGSQYSEQYDKWNKKVIVIWELPDVLSMDKDNVEFSKKMSREYTAFLGERTNLEKDLTAWRGKAFTPEEKQGFNLLSLLGVGCQMQIVHKEKNGKKFTNINSILALPKGTVIEPYEEPYYFDIDDMNSWKNLKRIPDWIKDKIKKNQDYEGSKLKEFIEANGQAIDENGMIVVEDGKSPF